MKLTILKLYCLICMGECRGVVTKYDVEYSSDDELFDNYVVIHLHIGVVFQGAAKLEYKLLGCKNLLTFVAQEKCASSN